MNGHKFHIGDVVLSTIDHQKDILYKVTAYNLFTDDLKPGTNFVRVEYLRPTWWNANLSDIREDCLRLVAEVGPGAELAMILFGGEREKKAIY